MKPVATPIEDENDGSTSLDNERLAAAISESRELREALTASAALLRKAMDRYACALVDFTPKE